MNIVQIASYIHINKKEKNRLHEEMKLEGFTLIELLCVVAILGILLTIIIPNFLNAQLKAKIAKVVGELNHLEKAIYLYHIDYDVYPAEMSKWIEKRVNQIKTGEVEGNRNGGWIDSNRGFGWDLNLQPYLPNGLPVDIFHNPHRYPSPTICNALTYHYCYWDSNGFRKEVYMDWKKAGAYEFAWKVSSDGPDRVSQGGWIHYHTSNGLVSRGDLIDGLSQPPLNSPGDYWPPEMDWKPEDSY